VDGDADACRRVKPLLGELTPVYRVGQRSEGPRKHGVAVNKNTGLELLMDLTDATHLFLSDDDASPLSPEALKLHLDMAQPSLGRADGEAIVHSMLGWGRHRLNTTQRTSGHLYAVWNWPRGVVMYQTRRVIEEIGGFVEAFGPGGHEHVEFSRRIYQHGLTPELFCTPAVYAMNNARGAYAFWHCEDMPGVNEPLGNFRVRKNRNTSVVRGHGDWDRINAIMAAQDGNTAFVPYRAHQNGRSSATLIRNTAPRSQT